jgi:hypothetical protein
MSDERWGVYDKTEDVWIGNDDGPVVYDNLMVARMAAQVTECALYGSDLGGRHEARVYPGGPKRLRDVVKNKMTPEQALARIESGVDDGQKKPLTIELAPYPKGDWTKPPHG